MLKIKTAIFLTLFGPYILKAQDGQPINNPIKKQSISLKFVGYTFPLGISYSQMLTDRLSMEIGFGIVSFGAGFDYYITNPRTHRFNLNTGIHGFLDYDAQPFVYLPLGVSCFGKNNFQYSINAGVIYSEVVSSRVLGNNASPSFGLTISKRFGQDFETSKSEQDIETSKSEQKTEFRNIISWRLGYIYPVIGINYERLLSPNLGLEATIGLIGASAGVNVYFPSIRPGKIVFKTGLNRGVSMGFNGLQKATYLPIGINYLFKGSFVLGVDFGLLHESEDFIPDFSNANFPNAYFSDFEGGFSIKLGKAF